ncbi:MAG: mannose-1-phosphate guanylyltransferase [Cyclobacteriaceae bacterium]|jgi:mannose-1-phosphate guanylyltransferase|nr:mannose-1-phosphate guanylyltransferase [Flammeovirgaceae bacterium]MCZ8021392.1 mannose-1-phosphate guanylyltransferase [Cytophagales bacterium]MCZ8327972.1 mannose-1-phosphate guanylyltransferase [Cyclobacteriaceae bacterium]
MNKNIYVVLMAGGVGVRFWPYSRNSRPKQFLDVMGTGRTLLQSTYDRFLPICKKENILVVTNEEHAALVQEQLPDLQSHQILAEPMRKNTAPCIAYASYKIKKENPDAIIVVSPADHLVLKEAEFREVIIKAANSAEKNDKLITLGIQPTRPETGYGYIQFIESKGFVKKVKTFTEKPALAIAKQFLDSGDFLWNAGIFIWGVQAIIKALQTHQPELAEVFEEIENDLGTPNEAKSIAKTYGQCKNISIDYAIMEKADNVYVCNGNFAWSDLGSWASIHDVSQKDENNNLKQAKTLLYDTKNTIIKASADKLVVVQGLNGYLVGEFGNVIIVCEKDKEDQFRKFVVDVKSLPGGGNEFL